MNTQAIDFPANESNIRNMTTYSRTIYAAAAIVALLVVVLPLWLMNRPGAPAVSSPEELFAANFSIPPAPEARDAKAETWRTAYASGNFRTAIAELNTLLSDPSFSRRSEAFHYLGVSQLASGHPEEAIRAFEQVNSESYDRESADWYTALAMLKLGKTEEAIKSLHTIAAQKNHPRRQQAKKMLDGQK